MAMMVLSRTSKNVPVFFRLPVCERYNKRVANHFMMPSTSEAARLDFPSDILQGWRGRCVLALVGSVFVALCAHVAVPLPFTPVPFTLQPFAVLLVGMVLGPAVGFATLVAYLIEGILGLPVFTPVGVPGIARLFGPTGGYLLAYPLAAALAGRVPCCLSTRAEQHGLVIFFTCR